jgi:hypothetical protein
MTMMQIRPVAMGMALRFMRVGMAVAGRYRSLVKMGVVFVVGVRMIVRHDVVLMVVAVPFDGEHQHRDADQQRRQQL